MAPFVVPQPSQRCLGLVGMLAWLGAANGIGRTPPFVVGCLLVSRTFDLSLCSTHFLHWIYAVLVLSAVLGVPLFVLDRWAWLVLCSSFRAAFACLHARRHTSVANLGQHTLKIAAQSRNPLVLAYYQTSVFDDLPSRIAVQATCAAAVLCSVIMLSHTRRQSSAAMPKVF